MLDQVRDMDEREISAVLVAQGTCVPEILNNKTYAEIMAGMHREGGASQNPARRKKYSVQIADLDFVLGVAKKYEAETGNKIPCYPPEEQAYGGPKLPVGVDGDYRTASLDAPSKPVNVVPVHGQY